MDSSVLVALASLLVAAFRIGHEVGRDVGRKRK